MPEFAFLGREKEIYQYKEFLKKKRPWLLSIIAVGGTGKTVLLSKMSEQTPPDIPVVHLDFTSTINSRGAPFEEDESARMPISPLKHLQIFVNELKKKNAIDTVAASEFDKTVKEAIEKSINQITINVQKIADRASSWKDTYRQQRAWVTPAFLGLIEKYKPDHLVVMLDTCEWLQEPINFDVGDWLMDELLIPLRDAMEARGKKCHVVMAGTLKPPQLKKIEDQEPNSIDRLELGELDKAAVIEYLQAIGMQRMGMPHVFQLLASYGKICAENHPLRMLSCMSACKKYH
jgi:hypothetical protein